MRHWAAISVAMGLCSNQVALGAEVSRIQVDSAFHVAGVCRQWVSLDAEGMDGNDFLELVLPDGAILLVAFSPNGVVETDHEERVVRFGAGEGKPSTLNVVYEMTTKPWNGDQGEIAIHAPVVRKAELPERIRWRFWSPEARKFAEFDPPLQRVEQQQLEKERGQLRKELARQSEQVGDTFASSQDWFEACAAYARAREWLGENPPEEVTEKMCQSMVGLAQELEGQGHPFAAIELLAEVLRPARNPESTAAREMLGRLLEAAENGDLEPEHLQRLQQVEKAGLQVRDSAYLETLFPPIEGANPEWVHRRIGLIARQPYDVRPGKLLQEKLDSMVLAEVDIVDEPVLDVIRYLMTVSRELDTSANDPARKGVGIEMRVRTLPWEGSDQGAALGFEGEDGDGQPRFTYQGKDVPFLTLLNAAVEKGGLGLRIWADRIQISSEHDASIPIEEAVYRLSPFSADAIISGGAEDFLNSLGWDSNYLDAEITHVDFGKMELRIRSSKGPLETVDVRKEAQGKETGYYRDTLVWPPPWKAFSMDNEEDWKSVFDARMRHIQIPAFEFRAVKLERVLDFLEGQSVIHDSVEGVGVKFRADSYTEVGEDEVTINFPGGTLDMALERLLEASPVLPSRPLGSGYWRLYRWPGEVVIRAPVLVGDHYTLVGKLPPGFDYPGFESEGTNAEALLSSFVEFPAGTLASFQSENLLVVRNTSENLARVRHWVAIAWAQPDYMPGAFFGHASGIEPSRPEEAFVVLESDRLVPEVGFYYRSGD